MPKVSIVVPIYGVEKYIERCARSLFEQTLDDIEYLFVDDCTKDSSIAVLESIISEYPDRRNQIRIIHHEQNKGLSYARETGVRNAIGDYIGHCDSDDWVDARMYETLYNAAISDNLDFVRCNYRVTDGNICLAEGKLRFDEELNDKTKIIGWAISDQGWNSIWSTLVSRSVYNGNSIEFTSQPMLEDMYVVIQLITHSNSFGVVNQALYNYFYNSQSISKAKDSSAIIKRTESAYLNVQGILQYVEENYDVGRLNKEVVFLKSIPRRDLIPALTDVKNYSYWSKYYSEIGLKPVFSCFLPIRIRINYLLAYLRLYSLFRMFKMG